MAESSNINDLQQVVGRNVVQDKGEMGGNLRKTFSNNAGS